MSELITSGIESGFSIVLNLNNVDQDQLASSDAS